MPRDGRPATVRPIVMEAVKACTDPLGATNAWIVKRTGLDRRTVSCMLSRLVKLNRSVFSVISASRSRYFDDAAKRDAAAPILLEQTLKLKREREAPPRPRVYEAVQAAVLASTAPLGESRKSLHEKIGGREKSVFQATLRLVSRGLAFSFGSDKGVRLFATAEARDAAAPELARILADAKKARAAEHLKYARDRYANDPIHRERILAKSRRAAEKRKPRGKPKAPKAAKPPKQVVVQAPKFKPAPTATASTPVQIKKPAKPSWKDLPAIVPPDVKVTKCPGFTPRTFAPPPFFPGEFTNQWRELRATR